MSLYYDNFRYLNTNSLDKGLIVTAFEPDNGFVDSFLSMEPVQEEHYNGTQKFDYGARYNSSAVVNIQVVKSDGTDFSLSDVRDISRWLTGSRINSWLEVGSVRFDYDNDPRVKYAFLGRVTNLQQYKMDGRVVGFKIEFTSISPWAYSRRQDIDLVFGENMLTFIEDNNFVTRGDGTIKNATININDDGILYNNASTEESYFLIDDDGVVYVDNVARAYIDNQTDDLYTYIGLDIYYQNVNSNTLSIINETLGETSAITGMSVGENITLSSQQFIVSDLPNKIFGDDFNFKWPRLAPGINNFIIDGSHQGSVHFSYRYPMKVGDCAMDIDVTGGGLLCSN